jgi:PAS domain S-box
MMDGEKRVSFWNESAEKKCLVTQKEKNPWKRLRRLILPERYCDVFLKGMENFKKDGTGPIINKTLILPGLRKDGAEFFADCSFSSVNLKGKWHAISIIRDITERKHAEETLLLHSKILENMNEGVNLVQANSGKIVYTNTQFDNLFGYEHGELIDRHVTALHAPVEATSEGEVKEIIRELNDKGRWSGEICNIKKDGTIFWCRSNVSTFSHQEYGEVWVSVHEDITERKQKDEELQLYGTLFDNISDLAYICDTKGNILFLNKAF